eukprot:TRINITY_DN303_c0_g1_i1.p2 TRINITY_DN303_c0_g1~~TRINITY_DN303_c0_g1_i1.p2  ORF type:complete len:83 (-),score=17.35 TRINITY_DN303_c0_g1_i1:186-434(-)
MYTEAHERIRADPLKARAVTERGDCETRDTPKGTEYPKKVFQKTKMSKTTTCGSSATEAQAYGESNVRQENGFVIGYYIMVV